MTECKSYWWWFFVLSILSFFSISIVIILHQEYLCILYSFVYKFSNQFCSKNCPHIGKISWRKKLFCKILFDVKERIWFISVQMLSVNINTSHFFELLNIYFNNILIVWFCKYQSVNIPNMHIISYRRKVFAGVLFSAHHINCFE